MHATGQLSASKAQRIWVIAGPAGCGKTSVANYLRDVYSMPFLEGDDFHTPTNIARMSAGQALTDADRWDWLILLREKALSTLSTPQAHNHEPPSGVVVTCSALKRKYRDVFRLATYGETNITVRFIFLDTKKVALLGRVGARQNHYMKAHMVESQLQAAELPEQDEEDAAVVQASGSNVEVQNLVIQAFREAELKIA